MRKYEQMSRFRPMYATILASLALLLTAAWGAATPAQADDQSDYTVTVDAGVTPTTIAPGQTASGTPGAGIVGNNATATSELPSTIPNPVFSVDSTVGVNGGDTAPSAGIDSNGNLNVTAGNSTTPDVYTVTVRATYTWTDAAGTKHTPYGVTAVSVTVPPDVLIIQDNQDSSPTDIYSEVTTSFTVTINANGSAATNISSQSYTVSTTGSLDVVNAPAGFTVTYSDDGGSATVTSNGSSSSTSLSISASVQITSCLGGVGGSVTCSGQAVPANGGALSGSDGVTLYSTSFCTD